MNLQMLKKAMLSYVSAVKFIWSELAHPLSIVGKKFMNLRGYRVYGNSIQDGTPTPETPVEIQSVGDLSTKNLFDTQGWYNWLRTFTTTYVQKQVVDGISCIYYRPSSTFNKEYMKGQFKVNTRYTISFRAKGIIGTDYSTGFRFMYTDGTSTSVSVSNNDTWNEYTLTSISGKTIDNIQMFLNYPQGCYFDENSIQLEEGTIATEYEPYHKYKIPVVARGRNLIPMFTFKTFTSNGVTFTNNNDGSITLNGTPTGYAVTPIMSLPYSSLEVLRNNACVLTGFYKCLGSNVTLGIDVFLDSALVKQYYISTSTSANYIKVDLRSLNFNKINLNVKRSNNDKLIDNVTVKPFLEVGTTMPTSFEPYIEPVTTNIFLDEPLRKVGDYADYIDFEKQKVVRNVSRTDSLRAGNIYNWNNRNGIMTASVLKYNSTRLKGMSNRLNVFTAIGNETCTFWLGVGNRVIYWVGILDVLGIYSDSKTSKEMIEEFNTWLADNPTYVIYPLTTPTEETVKLPAIPQFKGTTIYEVGTNIKPSGMEAKYC